MGSRAILRGAVLGASIFVAAPATALAANHCVSGANSSGSWSDPSVWTSCGGGYPGPGDTAELVAGADIVVAANATVANLSVDDGANLMLIDDTLTVTGAAALGSQPYSAGAEIMGSTSGTLAVSGTLTVGGATLTSMTVTVGGSSAETDFGYGATSPQTTSTWANSTLTQSGGTMNFWGPYTLNGVSPNVSATIGVHGNSTVQDSLNVNAPASFVFHPAAAEATGGASMLNVNALALQGGVTASTVFDAGYTPSVGDRANLLSAQGSVTALSAPDTTSENFFTDTNGQRLYGIVAPPIGTPATAPTLTLGEPAPAAPMGGASVSVPITASAGASVSCSVDGATIPCTSTAATFTAPDADSTTLSVSATNTAGVTTRSSTIAVYWLPALVELQPTAPNEETATVDRSNWPANSIDCSQLDQASDVSGPQNGAIFAAPLFAYNATGPGYPVFTGPYVTCVPSANSLFFVDPAQVGATEQLIVPTSFGDFTIWIQGQPRKTTSATAAIAPPGFTASGPLTCPTAAGAQGYAWVINGVFTTTTGPTLPAQNLPTNATVSCGAISASGPLLGLAMLIDQGVRISASTSTSGGDGAAASAFETKKKTSTPATVTLTIKASKSDTVQLKAYNTTTSGSEASAKTTQKLVYTLTVKLKRGTTVVHFGPKLKVGGYEIVLRGAHTHGEKVTYGKTLVID